MVTRQLLDFEPEPPIDGFESIPLGDVQAYLEFRSGSLLSPPPQLTIAWERFYRLTNHLIRRGVRIPLLSVADQDDCAQESWREIIVHLRHFRHDPAKSHLASWIAKVTSNKVKDWFRERRRHQPKNCGDRRFDIPGLDLDPARECERQGEIALVRSALDELARRVSPSNFRVLYLRSIEEKTVAEVATELRLTPERVRYRHHRMKRRIRSVFDLMEGSPDPSVACEPSGSRA